MTDCAISNIPLNKMYDTLQPEIKRAPYMHFLEIDEHINVSVLEICEIVMWDLQYLGNFIFYYLLHYYILLILFRSLDFHDQL